MNETLAELVDRRLRELGQQRGRDKLSLREAWLPYEGQLSYETLRRAEKGTHTNLRDDSIDALALMLDVPASEVMDAAGLKPRLGAFKLPRRAERLDAPERKVIVAVVDAILNAKGGAQKCNPPDPKQPDTKQEGNEVAGRQVRVRPNRATERTGERAVSPSSLGGANDDDRPLRPAGNEVQPAE